MFHGNQRINSPVAEHRVFTVSLKNTCLKQIVVIKNAIVQEVKCQRFIRIPNKRYALNTARKIKRQINQATDEQDSDESTVNLDVPHELQMRQIHENSLVRNQNIEQIPIGVRDYPDRQENIVVVKHVAVVRH